MAFPFDGRSAPWRKLGGVLALALWSASCASAPPPPVASAGDDVHQCIKTASVDLVRLDPGPPPKVDPAMLLRYYPDRAWRMMEQGAATYDCRLDGAATVCGAAQADPVDMGFEHIPVGKLVTLATGETMRLRMTFKILETERCKVQYAPA